MSASKPALVFIPGAWHKADSWETIFPQLEAQGYECHALTMPSVGAPQPTTHFDDAAHIQTTLSKLIHEQGKDVVIVMHSYGGAPGTQSAKGFAKKDIEATGKSGGVVGLVYIASFLLPLGVSLAGLLGGEHFPPPWTSVEVGVMLCFVLSVCPPGCLGSIFEKLTVVNEQGDHAYAHQSDEIFYADLPPAEQERLTARLPHHSLSAFKSELSYAAYQDIPTSYLLCRADKAIPLFAQEMMVQAGKVSPQRTFVCDSAHFPMYSMPDTVMAVIRQAAGEDVKVPL